MKGREELEGDSLRSVVGKVTNEIRECGEKNMQGREGDSASGFKCVSFPVTCALGRGEYRGQK